MLWWKAMTWPGLQEITRSRGCGAFAEPLTAQPTGQEGLVPRAREDGKRASGEVCAALTVEFAGGELGEVGVGVRQDAELAGLEVGHEVDRVGERVPPVVRPLVRAGREARVAGLAAVVAQVEPAQLVVPVASVCVAQQLVSEGEERWRQLRHHSPRCQPWSSVLAPGVVGGWPSLPPSPTAG